LRRATITVPDAADVGEDPGLSCGGGFTQIPTTTARTKHPPFLACGPRRDGCQLTGGRRSASAKLPLAARGAATWDRTAGTCAVLIGCSPRPWPRARAAATRWRCWARAVVELSGRVASEGAKPVLDEPVPRYTLVRLGLVAAPFLALLAAVPVAWGWDLSWRDLAIGSLTYLLSGLGIAVGFHRYFTHGSFKAVRWLRVVLAVAGSLAVEG